MGEHNLTITDEHLEQHIVTLFEKLETLRSSGLSQEDGRTLLVPARHELRSGGLWRGAAAECAASALYVLAVCGAAAGAGVGASTSAVLLATALASGCIVATLTLCFANISGAHINPAVSAALCVRRRVSPLRAALYIAAQCGGGIIGAAAVYGVSMPGYTGGLSAALPGGGPAWERLGAELLLTALIAATYFACMERRWTGAAPALLGAAYCGATLVSMPSLNPARSLGPSFVLSRWESHWVSWVGGIGGGIACGLLYEWGSRRPRTSSSRASSPRDLDDLDKPSFPGNYRHAATYCPAAPRPDHAEPLYSGSKSLYCRSPPPARHPLHRSQSVYSKTSTGVSASAAAAAGGLLAAQSLLLRAPAAPHPAHPALPAHPSHPHATLQNVHNAQRDPHYGTAPPHRPGPTGAASNERRESIYGRRSDCSQSTVSGAGGAGSAGAAGYGRVYRAPPPDHY